MEIWQQSFLNQDIINKNFIVPLYAKYQQTEVNVKKKNYAVIYF